MMYRHHRARKTSLGILFAALLASAGHSVTAAAYEPAGPPQPNSSEVPVEDVADASLNPRGVSRLITRAFAGGTGASDVDDTKPTVHTDSFTTRVFSDASSDVPVSSGAYAEATQASTVTPSRITSEGYGSGQSANLAGGDVTNTLRLAFTAPSTAEWTLEMTVRSNGLTCLDPILGELELGAVGAMPDVVQKIPCRSEVDKKTYRRTVQLQAGTRYYYSVEFADVGVTRLGFPGKFSWNLSLQQNSPAR